jgi:catechol 2,3-dioxygenase-like lactoylglutathione lyase family enzyme
MGGMADFVKTGRWRDRSVVAMTPTIDAIGLVVADMAASLAFYRRLGLEIPASADAEPHVEVALAGGMRLLFDTVETIRSFDETWRPPSSGYRMNLAVACATASEVDGLHAALVDAGYSSHLAPFDAFWGQRYAAVLDPDGNPVELHAPVG